jgi:hypothetical protein
MTSGTGERQHRPRETDSAGAATTWLFAQAAITVVALLLVFAALDDITTDRAMTFRLEYTFLGASAAWLMFVAWSLVRAGHRTLGYASLVALAGALWALSAIRPGIVPARRPEFVVMATAYVWFWFLAGAMLWLAWCAGKRQARRPA